VIARDALFPNGRPAPQVPDPTDVECAELRTQAEVAIGAFMPGGSHLFQSRLD
jgi:hypothetical protein